MVILLDQLSRNIHRGTAEMYAADADALRRVGAAVEAGFDQELPTALRAFLYMPAMHAETLEDQDRSVEWFQRLVADDPGLAGNLESAHQHRDLVKRYGRFPHRNKILGRESTPAEVLYLEKSPNPF